MFIFWQSILNQTCAPRRRQPPEGKIVSPREVGFTSRCFPERLLKIFLPLVSVLLMPFSVIPHNNTEFERFGLRVHVSLCRLNVPVIASEYPEDVHTASRKINKKVLPHAVTQPRVNPDLNSPLLSPCGFCFPLTAVVWVWMHTCPNMVCESVCPHVCVCICVHVSLIKGVWSVFNDWPRKHQWEKNEG